MKVIAVRGKELELLVEDNTDITDPKAKGIIRDKRTNKESKLMPIQQIIKWGYWEECVSPEFQLLDNYLLGGPGSGYFGHAGRPGKRGGSASKGLGSIAESVVRTPSEELQSTIDQNIGEVSRREGIPPSEIERIALDNLDEIIEESMIAIRVPPEVVGNILFEGEFHNQHYADVHSSGGAFDPDLRAKVESEGFNVTRNEQPEEYPIYGYLSGSLDQDQAAHYGNVEFLLKSSLFDRTTITVGDSLDSDLGTGVGASPILSPRRESLDGHRNIEALYSRDFNYIEYIEAQIHGGIKLGDIAQVIFHVPPGRTSFDVEIKALQNLRIPARYEEDGW